MDIIPYGIASKATKQEQYTRNDVLGIGVEGTYPHVKARIDNLEKAIQGVVAQADKLIVNDAINIMKAHAKLNAVAKSMKYKMYNMIFDDLLDLSGIDVVNSSGYTHDSVNGTLKASVSNSPFVIETKTEDLGIIPTKAILMANESINKVQKMKIDSSEITGYQVSNLLDAIDDNMSTCAIMSPGFNYSTITITFTEPKDIDSITLKSDQRLTLKLWNSSGIKVYDNYIDANGTAILNLTNITKIQLYIVTQTVRIYDIAINAKIFMEAQDNMGVYKISIDNGQTWEIIQPESLFYFKQGINSSNIKLRMELPGDRQLDNYAFTWA